MRKAVKALAWFIGLGQMVLAYGAMLTFDMMTMTGVVVAGLLATCWAFTLCMIVYNIDELIPARGEGSTK